MADIDSTTVTPIRPFEDAEALSWLKSQPGGYTNLPAAELARRWGWGRHKPARRLEAWQKAGLITRHGNTVTAVDATPATLVPAVAPDATSPVTSLALVARVAPNPVTASERNTGVTVSTLASALALATVSGGFSITGMTAVFIGSFWPVIGMGVALEIGKLSAVAALPTLRRGALKTALGILVVVLMALNAIGAYGFLAKAHIGHALAGDLAVSARSADVDARLSVQAGKVADLTKQLADLDAAHTVEAPVAGNLRTAAAINAQAAALAAAAKLRAADDERRQAKRNGLADKLTAEAKALADLKVEKATVESERRTIEADLGPIRYLATLLGAGDQDVLRWFILVVALLLDPAAVLLLLAAVRTRS